MRALILIVLVIKSSAYLIKIPKTQEPVNYDREPKEWITRQIKVLNLFENICEPSTDPIITNLAEQFDTTASNEDYINSDVLVKLKNLQSSNGLLSKGEIFSEFKEEHFNQLKIIYDVMFYAKDFDAFYKAASWARQTVNCGIFVDAIYLTILKRSDLQNISLPAPYEILPNYFIRKDAILKVSSIMNNSMTTIDDVQIEGNRYTIETNYTGDLNENEEYSKLSYFYEDIGLNTYYYLRRLLVIPWDHSETNLTSQYGEYIYQIMKSAAARYNLERYSNGLPELEELDWNTTNSLPYNPFLIYSSGDDFGYRTKSLKMESESIEFLQNIENNILTVVSRMNQSGYNKSQIINHLIDLLVINDNSYETIARKVLDNDVENRDGQPTVLEHYMTTMRDPSFWNLNNKLVDIIDRTLKILPTYSKNELWFPGVEIVNVEVKKIMTNFDYFELDVTDALKTAENNVSFQVKIKQPRLNHKPFTIKLDISSQVTQKGLVKLYIGPKMLPWELYTKKNLFMLFDTFEINLKVGSNVISRKSDEIKTLSNDFMSLDSLRMNAEYATYGYDMLHTGNIESTIGFPNRLLLPKGSSEGLPAQIFVFVAPFSKYDFDVVNSNMAINSAVLSPGYPLDLDIENAQLFSLPNAMIKNIIITHKGDVTMKNFKKSAGKNAPTNETSEPVDFSQRKTYFDYSSKKSQYSQNEYGAPEQSWANNTQYENRQSGGNETVLKDETIKRFSNNNTDLMQQNNSKIDNNKFTLNEMTEGYDNKQTIPQPAMSSSTEHTPTVFDYLTRSKYNSNYLAEEVYV